MLDEFPRFSFGHFFFLIPFIHLLLAINNGGRQENYFPDLFGLRGGSLLSSEEG